MPCCETCVCVGEPFDCLSVIDPANFGYLADWCRSGSDLHRRHVLGRSRIAAGAGLVAVATPPVAIQAAPPTQAPPIRPPTPALALALDRRTKVHECAYRGAAVGCPCAGRHLCSLGKGHVPGEPTFAECMACVGEAG